MTLTEFLLDRIAEDEAAGEKVADIFMQGDRTGLPELRTLHPTLYMWVRRWTPHRVFAEVDVKRLIMAANPVGDLGEPVPDVLRLLALAYAEYPDYALIDDA